MGALTLRVADVRDLSSDVRQFSMASDALLPPVEPGAHIDLFLPDGSSRQYSLLTPFCTPTLYVVAIKREQAGRGGSAWFHDHLLTGAEIDVSVPRNHFGLEEDAGESLLLAGGIGITPIYAMFRHLREHGKAVRLHYWSRSPSDMLFSESLQAEQNVYLHHSSSGRRDVADILHDTAPGTVVYCCGPRRMLEACQAAMPRGCVLKTENFLPAASPDDACMQGFSVYLAKSDCTVEVATNQTILQALLSAGIDAPYSCEEGVCGACEVSLLAGEALHLDAVRLPAEHDRLRTVMVCCSRAKTNSLTLDL